MEATVSMEQERISYADVRGLQWGIKEMKAGGWQVEEVQERPDGGFEATFIRAPPDSHDADPADFDPVGQLRQR